MHSSVAWASKAAAPGAYLPLRRETGVGSEIGGELGTQPRYMRGWQPLVRASRSRGAASPPSPARGGLRVLTSRLGLVLSVLFFTNESPTMDHTAH